MDSVSTNETNRLNALQQSGLLELSPSRLLMTLLEVAKRTFGVDIVTVTLVDEERQKFLARIGLEPSETPRDVSFCTHTIQQNTPLIVTDAKRHSAFKDNPLVNGYPYIRFYSGVPIRSASGYKIGTFCLIDQSPKSLEEHDVELQIKIAALVEHELKRMSQLSFDEGPDPERINLSVLRAQNIFLETNSERQTFDLLLSDLLALTESSFGFIAEVKFRDCRTSSQPYLKMKSISNIAWDESSRALYDDYQAQGLEFDNLDNLLGAPLREKRTVIVDEVATDKRAGGTPAGHPDIKNYCAIPIMSQNQVIGLIGLANRPSGYTQDFVASLEAMTLSVGVLIERSHMLAEREQHSQRLFNAAHIDDVTSLPNRRSLNLRIEQIINNANDASFALCFIDIDGFKSVNDRLGHEQADQVLAALGKRLQQQVHEQDFVARISGDEFVIIMLKPSVAEYQRILSVIQQPLTVHNSQLSLSASMGVARYPEDGHEPDQLLRYADQAMYLAKQNGKNRYHQFDLALYHEKLRRTQLIEAVAEAIQLEQVQPFLQPKMDIASQQLIGFEVLSRWQHPQRGLLVPQQFIDELTGSKTLVALDDYMLQQAVPLLDALQQRHGKVSLNVNVSPEYFNSDEFITRLEQLSSQAPDKVPLIVLEIVESTPLGDLESAVTRLRYCQTLGFKTSLDDFGTNFSSLTYFKALPVDEVKIDRSFIADLLHDANAEVIVSVIIQLATAFSRTVVAEGIETEQQMQTLKALGCGYAQGYLYGRPMPLQQALEFRWKPIS